MLNWSFSFSTSECKIKGVDMMFVMDESGSINREHFQLMRDMAITITDAFEISPERTRVGWINFDDQARVIFSLNTYQTKESLHSAIRAVPYSAGGTNISEGLLALYNYGFDGARDSFDVPDVAIVVTDGQSDIEPIREAAALLKRDRNVDMFVVGVGSGIKYEQLEAVAAAGIASDPSRNIFLLTGFVEEGLSQLQDTLKARTCFSELYSMEQLTFSFYSCHLSY